MHLRHSQTDRRTLTSRYKIRQMLYTMVYCIHKDYVVFAWQGHFYIGGQWATPPLLSQRSSPTAPLSLMKFLVVLM